MSKWTFTGSKPSYGLAWLLVVLLAVAFRLPRLDLRPMHCDEANQAARTNVLWETGRYQYDTHDHHGPSLYWLTLPSLWLSGAQDFGHTTEWQYRLVPVLFGLGLILLLPLVADGLGRPAACMAGLLTAISPAMVFYSRDYIQETLLVFFTFAAMASAWRYCRTRSAGWAVTAGLCFGLMHATKETWTLAAAAMVAGLVLELAWTRWRLGATAGLSSSAGNTRPYLRPLPLLAAMLAAGLVVVALYSSLGRNWHGPLDSILAYGNYVRRGSESGIHVHPWYYYLQLLVAYHPQRGFFWSEGFIVGLAAIGFLFSLGSGTLGQAFPRFCRFLAFYTLTLTTLYCLIPYKTPWCLLSFLQGMILLAGLGAVELLRRLRGVPLKVLAAALLVVGSVHLGWQCYALNFRFYADQRNPYVYAQTPTDILNLAARMEQLARVSPQGHDLLIHVVTPEIYWPLPWYLRQFNRDRIGYWSDPAVWAEAAAQGDWPSVIILTPDVQSAVDAHLRAAYNKQMIYGLRPGVFLLVYVRQDLWKTL
jgi:uncharacterized protein (TIGR03663 family)